MTLTRKDFLHSVAGFGAGALIITILPGCADHDDDGEPAEGLTDAELGSCSPNAVISSNHGHSVVVFSSHVTAGTERTYSIQGSSSHRHFITVTAAMFQQLQAGQPVEVTSGGTSHTHKVTLSCVPFCDRGVTISNNHGHSLVVPFTHVAYGSERTYSIQGTSSHRHFITVTPAMFAQLRANQPITVESGGVSHTHMVTISCVLPAPACTPAPLFTANHGHLLNASADDVTAGVEKSYDVKGVATHTHTVVVTAAMFQMLQQGTSVSTVTMGGTHVHTVTISCAPSAAEALGF
jgi:hypothetical protein